MPGRKPQDENYRDRPSDDGKYGDGDEQPNAGFPSEPEPQDKVPGEKPPR